MEAASIASHDHVRLWSQADELDDLTITHVALPVGQLVLMVGVVQRMVGAVVAVVDHVLDGIQHVGSCPVPDLDEEGIPFFGKKRRSYWLCHSHTCHETMKNLELTCPRPAPKPKSKRA